MDVLEFGANLLKQQLGSQASTQIIGGALGQLLGASGGKLDIGKLVAQIGGQSGLQNALQSWLGDGQNAAITPAQIIALFGEGKLGSFAKQIGVDSGAAASGLAAVLPSMIDKFSSGGNLLESVIGSAVGGGSAGGLGGLIGGLLKK